MLTPSQFNALCDAMIEYHTDQEAISERKADELRQTLWNWAPIGTMRSQDLPDYPLLIWKPALEQQHLRRDSEYDNDALDHWAELTKWRILQQELPPNHWEHTSRCG
ncbi:uncharacterized protein QC763_0106150 [Podospora pseudopauciseta]|uniref:Uncharacterized protein n=2 Tax=Podospora TaxID=5144 RepID=A0ABR0H134_9PEZI|nr:hypothetical protein QC763_0106150 [Podospora pseudopauciseta]KAK4668432.1 hypothetical protein QC764_0102130 [Podospora pseudoanserina]